MGGVKIWFISGLESKHIVTKDTLTLFDDRQRDVPRDAKGDA